MSPSSLPARPNLEQLRKQAKDLLKAYRSGDPSVAARFRTSLSRYSGLPDRELHQLPLSLADAQRVVAGEYGFQNWLHLRDSIERKEDTSMIEMTVDHVRIDQLSDHRVIVLKAKEDERRLPILVGKTGGDAIAMKLQGQEMPRPMTFSVMDTVIRDLGGEVEQVVVMGLKGDTFLAILRVKNGESAIDYDSRPSDAIALAVYCGAPLFAEPGVLAKAGVQVNPQSGEILPPTGAEGDSSEEPGEVEASEMFRNAEKVMKNQWHIVRDGR